MPKGRKKKTPAKVTKLATIHENEPGKRRSRKQAQKKTQLREINEDEEPADFPELSPSAYLDLALQYPEMTVKPAGLVPAVILAHSGTQYVAITGAGNRISLFAPKEGKFADLKKGTVALVKKKVTTGVCTVSWVLWKRRLHWMTT